MSLGALIFAQLSPLVAAKCWPDQYSQVSGLPIVPAIRYTRISGVTYPDLCGDGGEDADDVRYQIDCVHKTAQERDTLCAAIREQMSLLAVPALAQGPARNGIDSVTKLYTGSIDFILYQTLS